VISTERPSVSVVMPVRNEVEGLVTAVESVLQQDYEGDLDLWVAVAPSIDGTEGLLDGLAAEHPQVHRVDNPSGHTPAGLNAAIAAGAGEVIVRVDGHARLPQAYIRTAVATLLRTGGVNVGGRQHAVGRTPFECAVAAVTNSWLGAGGARYRTGGAAGPVDTVYLGVFRREAGDAVGWFDEGLLRNQDYELNVRLRDAGGVVWFDPDLVVEYRPRSSYRALARQYFEYGQFKARVLAAHPRSLRVRQLLPALLLPGVVLSAVVSWFTVFGPVPVAGYLGAVGLAVVSTRQGSWHAMPVVLTIHVAWSAGFWAGVGRWLRQVLTSGDSAGRVANS